ncbi:MULTISPECIES: hypothetical protein [unclassified Streptomyces]|uniref:hypothetical protein n=1 Tax=unclassified Streptomyces TaxID=2593676 RepID=UPI0006AF157C|nr:MULTISPECIES: hypothetical protein [unclassified Streptomyces]KOX25675.1 hypothetical protein ADL06_18485 [Streptomyces sp. NRRL F-6491]KOX41461.1 hypothetical protein ADL08_18730 [Streptomyces sp. NRRL F-6492]
MSERHTLIRSLHDVGLAAWFGGSLMGAVGLNGAARSEGGTEVAADRIASAGWAKWTPVSAVAIGAHLFGSGGLLVVNAHRVATQQGVAASTAAKTAVTAAALAATAYARVLGKKIELASSSDPEDVEKAGRHPVDLDKARRQLACAQWVVPALTGCLVVLNALHGEQQRPSEQVSGMWGRAESLSRHVAPGISHHLPH